MYRPKTTMAATMSMLPTLTPDTRATELSLGAVVTKSAINSKQRVFRAYANASKCINIVSFEYDKNPKSNREIKATSSE